MAIETIKFSEMPNAGNINNNDIMPSLRTGENVILNNPWTFLPPGTTAERPTPSSTVNFRLRFNTEDQLYEYYDAVLGMWTQLQESAFTQGPFIIYTADPSIPDGQNLGALANGILKQTITLGVATLDIAVNGTDYWKPGDALTRTQVPVVGDDVTNKTYVDAQVAGAVTSVQGTANQVLVNATSGSPVTGAITLTTPQDIGLTSSPTFDNLQLSGGIIVGADGTTVFELVNTALSVNHIRATSQVTGTNPSLSAIGTDTNIGLTLSTKGTGAISLVTANTTQPILIYSGTSNQHITRFNMANTAADRSVTFQDASGTLAYLSDLPSITPSALTKTDDTNVTLTLGGTPATALLQATSLTLGWTGFLGTGRGGLGIGTTPANGQIPIGNGTNYVAATITAGANISVVNAGGSITISATGLGGFSWNMVTGTSQAMLSNNGYFANNAGLVTLTLPVTSAVGDEIDIIGIGAGGWKVQCGTGQTIVVGSSTTSTAGSIASTHAKDSFYMICTVANTQWQVGSAPQSAGITIA